jgi:transposase-like protein
VLVQRRRESRAALRLMRKLLKKQGFAPKLLVTDKLRSYAPAFRRLRLTGRHEQGLQEEQSGGELASGGATTRAQAAAVQVSSICLVLSEHAHHGSQDLQPATPPHLPIHIADLPSRS